MLVTAPFSAPLAKSSKRGLLVLFAAAALQACRGDSPPSATIAIQSVSPANENPLVSGDRIVFNVSVLARGLLKSGNVTLVIQSANGTLLGASQPLPLSNGNIAKLSVAVDVPEAATVRIFTPLYADGAETTDILDT